MMDAMPLTKQPSPSTATKPAPGRCIALILQGGGALGAYQAGVYQALHEADLEPDWVAGVSIGAINSALIAGNPPERRLERLAEFWDIVTSRDILPPAGEGDAARKWRNAMSAMQAMMLGQPGFFKPNQANAWLSPRGAKTATAMYDTSPLRETLHRLVDFDLINTRATRFAVGAVNVESANFVYFDNQETAIGPEHVMASGALPPALPMVRIGSEFYWDGGLVSNTPLQHVLDNVRSEKRLVFQVDLFSARGDLPRDMPEVLSRQKDIQYSSRTRMTTDHFTQTHRLKQALFEALSLIPDAKLSDAQRRQKAELSSLPEINIMQMIYRQKAYEGDAKDYEFSRLSMREHWKTGYHDTRNTLAHKSWLELSSNGSGIEVHDIHTAKD